MMASVVVSFDQAKYVRSRAGTREKVRKNADFVAGSLALFRRAYEPVHVNKQGLLEGSS
jgi:hypothetical protein